jgi:uncharacterized pyridoxamine 5'-phosphate oxidase family protein
MTERGTGSVSMMKGEAVNMSSINQNRQTIRLGGRMLFPESRKLKRYTQARPHDSIRGGCARWSASERLDAI